MPLRLTMDQAATPKGRKPDSIPFRKDENELIEEGLLDGVMAWHPRNDAFGTDSAKRVEDAFEHVERSLHNLRAILGMPARGDDGRAA